MPIKGITDAPVEFPMIGRINKGAPKEPNKPGKDLEYFRVELDDPELQKKFVASYGEKPNQIDIIFPFTEINKVWDANMETYVATRRIAVSDGEYLSYLLDHSTGEVLVRNGKAVRTFTLNGKERQLGQSVPHDPDTPVGTYNGKDLMLKPLGRLRVMIPALEQFGYLMLTTSSWNDCRNISANLLAYEDTLKKLGKTIMGAKFRLVRHPRSVSIPDPRDPSKRKRVTKNLIYIETAPDWVSGTIKEIQRLAMPILPELPENIEEDVDGQYMEIESGNEVRYDDGVVEVAEQSQPENRTVDTDPDSENGSASDGPDEIFEGDFQPAEEAGQADQTVVVESSNDAGGDDPYRPYPPERLVKEMRTWIGSVRDHIKSRKKTYSAEQTLAYQNVIREKLEKAFNNDPSMVGDFLNWLGYGSISSLPADVCVALMAKWMGLADKDDPMSSVSQMEAGMAVEYYRSGVD